jgi:hypothetical protein
MAVSALIFQPYCSCSRNIGYLQYEFEDLCRSMSKVEAATILKLRMCCRSQTLHCTLYHIYATNIGRVKVDVDSVKVEPDQINTPLIKLKKLPPPFFVIPNRPISYSSSLEEEVKKSMMTFTMPSGLVASDALM